MAKYVFVLLVLIAGEVSMAQSSYYPRDTTYTIRSAYQNIKERHPKVKPVFPKLARSVAAHENLVYGKLPDGRELHLDIFQPKGKKKPAPTVLIIHGGGWISGSKENMIPMAQALAKKGFVAVTVEYRLGREAPYPAGVHDVKAAIRWLRAHAEDYGIDAEKVAAYGCSAGAHLASLLGTTNKLDIYDEHLWNQEQSASVQAILNIDGIVSFVHPEAEPEWTGLSANTWLGSYAENRERWKEASPLEYVSQDTPPILFVNSSFPRFHAGRDDMLAFLDQHDIYYEVHTLAGSPHSFWLLDPWFKPTLRRTLRFLRKVF